MPGRKIAEVIQTALPDGNDFRARDQRTHLRIALGRVLRRVVRMHARGGEQFARVRAREFKGFRRMLAAGPGDHHLHDASITGALQHRFTVVAKAVVRQVRTDIDQFHLEILFGGARAR